MNLRCGALAFVGLIGLSVHGAASAAQASPWIEVSRAQNLVYEARSGSLEYSVTEKTKEPIIALTVRVRDLRPGGAITFEKNYVRAIDCANGRGNVVTTDLDGRARFQTEFMLQGGSVASQIAEIICAAAIHDLQTPKDGPENARF